MGKRPNFEEFKKLAMQNEKFKAEYKILEPELIHPRNGHKAS
jgi:hypothetical protein